MERYEARECLSYFASLYAGVRVDAKTTDGWYAILKGFDKEKIMRIIPRVIRKKSRFKISVTDIYNEALDTPDVSQWNLVGGSLIVNVDFPGSRFPFTFRSKEDRSEFLEKLKKRHTQKDVQAMHEEHVREKLESAQCTAVEADDKEAPFKTVCEAMEALRKMQKGKLTNAKQKGGRI